MKIRTKITKFAAIGSAAVALGLGVTACASTATEEKPSVEAETTTAAEPQAKTAATAEEAVALLKAGNADFKDGKDTTNISVKTREELVAGQHPYATVVTCADSRVPAEEIFNGGLGEIFTVATAGNVIGDYELGSVEYGAEHLGTPIVLVMGHTHCGAVGAAAEGGHAAGKIADIVEEIKPSVDKASKSVTGEEAIAREAEKLNVENSIAEIRKSEVIKHLEETGKVKVQGAIYDISTGEVTFL